MTGTQPNALTGSAESTSGSSEAHTDSAAPTSDSSKAHTGSAAAPSGSSKAPASCAASPSGSSDSESLCPCDRRAHLRSTIRSAEILVLYDGHCPLCQRSVQRLQRWDKNGRLTFVSLHHPDVPRELPDLHLEDLKREIHVLDEQGRVFSGAEALRVLSRRLPRLWWLVPFLHLPFSLRLWQRLYRKVSARRQDLFPMKPCACQATSERQHPHGSVDPH